MGMGWCFSGLLDAFCNDISSIEEAVDNSLMCRLSARCHITPKPSVRVSMNMCVGVLMLMLILILMLSFSFMPGCGLYVCVFISVCGAHTTKKGFQYGHTDEKQYAHTRHT